MKRLINALRARMHRTCTEVIDIQHECIVKSAEAHADSAAELIAARDESLRLRSRISELEHAPRRALAILRKPMVLGRQEEDPLAAAECHQRMTWFAFTQLAIHMENAGYEQTGASLRQMAELHRQRLAEALDTLAGPERTAELLACLEAMAAEPPPVPAPRQEVSA